MVDGPADALRRLTRCGAEARTRPVPGAEHDERTRRAGRGLIVIAGVKGYHIVTGYAITIVLPRLLGSPEIFGLYSKVSAALALITNVLTAATLQSVSKFISEDEQRSGPVFRPLLALQLGLGALVSTALFAAAPKIAEFHRDPELLRLMRIVAIVPFCYAAYAAAGGYLNGRHRFLRQAKLDAAFYSFRFVGILGGAALLGHGALGPIGGLATAAVLSGLFALVFSGVGSRAAMPQIRRWLSFMAPLWLYHAVVNAILELDIQVLAKTVSELALASGASEASASAVANTHAGFYHAAQTFAFVPYQLMLAMTAIVFPIIARATSTGNENEVRETIRSAMRVSLLALLSVTAPLAGAADGVMLLAYPDEYLAGAPALEVLSFGIVACALFVVAGTVLSSAGRPLATALIAIVGLIVSVTSTWLFVRHVGIGEDTLAAAALGSSLGMGVAFLLSGLAVHLRFHTLFPPASVLRATAAAAAGFAAARLVPHASPPGALAALVAGFAVYTIALLLLGEITPADRTALRAIVHQRFKGRK